MWQKRDEIVFILQTISMSLRSSGCHVAISAGWQTYHPRRRLTLSTAATAAVVARNGFVAIETLDYCQSEGSHPHKNVTKLCTFSKTTKCHAIHYHFLANLKKTVSYKLSLDLEIFYSEMVSNETAVIITNLSNHDLLL